MSKTSRFYRTVLVGAVLAALLLLAPRPAAADAVVDLTASAGTDMITGQFQFDEVQSHGVCCSDSVGSWSFDLSSLGLTNISGSGGGIAVEAGFDQIDFVDFGANNQTVLELFVAEPSDLAPYNRFGIAPPVVLEWNGSLTEEALPTVVLTPVAPVPEPSSILLLGSALAGGIALLAVLAGIERRHRMALSGQH